jgi:hypothetical protein
MEHSDLSSANNKVIKSQDNWKVDTIANQIFRELSGTTTLSTIKEVLNEVIPKYENARIQMFVPIFIRRDTINQLKSMQALYLASAMTISGADEKNESRANSDPSARRIDRDEQDKAIGTALRHLKPAARGDLIETLF